MADDSAKFIAGKLSALRELMDRRGLDSIWLQRTSSFAWATDGAASYINTASTTGEASLLITRDRHYLLTNNIEATRLESEEHLKDQGWEFVLDQWYDPADAVARLGGRTASDMGGEVAGEISVLRSRLNQREIDRFRFNAQQCAAAMDAACRAVRPGMSEHHIAALLLDETQKRGPQPVVVLVATDERIFNYRHPLPTAKKLDRYAMLILCGRWLGGVVSLTRLVYFGAALPEEIGRKNRACCQVNATALAATRAGRTIGDVFADIQAAYETAGFPGEWKLHHQGGSAGFEPRETLGKPGVKAPVEAGQVYAWNPSITGTKVEDSVLVTADGIEILTEIPGWPSLEVTSPDGRTWHQPDILLIK